MKRIHVRPLFNAAATGRPGGPPASFQLYIARTSRPRSWCRGLRGFLLAALLALGWVATARAVVTEKVTRDTFGAFSAGELDNVSLTSDGHLELAPALTNLASVTDPIIWAAVRDANGDVYFGTGNQGKVYQLTPKGELSTFFAPNEVMVHALALGPKGRLYAATSPNGRVYRLNAKGQAEVYCAPHVTYIWAMTFGKDGSLYLATGDDGKILRVPPGHSGAAHVETYFDTDEKNITALAWDKAGDLLAGTSPHGYLYRIDKANHGWVVFNSGQKEIKQIAVAPDGTIYVSTFSGKGGAEASDADPPGMMIVSSNISARESALHAGVTPNASGLHPQPAQGGTPARAVAAALAAAVRSKSKTPGSAAKARGGIYRIDTNGFYELYWSAPAGEAIYAMSLLRNGNLLAGTGDKGRIYSITDANHWKLLQKTSDGAQVAALLPAGAKSKEYFAATSHPAKIYRLDFSLAEQGTYTSKAFDAGQKSQWGRLHPDGAAPAGTELEFSTRSGNTQKPEKTWSDWTKPRPLSAEIAVTSPAARYLQYRIEFKRKADKPSATARLRRLEFYYQNFNAAPVLSRVKVVNKGFSISKMPTPQLGAPAVNLNQLLNGNGDAASNPAAAALRALLAHPPLRETKNPGYCTVVWDARDPNGDKLTYSVAIRAEGDPQWSTLVDKTQDTFYSFNTTGFHEGLYFVKVTASDLPSNTPKTARTTEAVSAAFLIDNTPPVLTLKQQSVKKDQARMVVNAVDGASVISSASYSLDGKAAAALLPDDLIFDSTNETFTLELHDLRPGAHSVLLRVQDEAKNTSVLTLSFKSR